MASHVDAKSKRKAPKFIDIFVKTLNGKTITIEITPNATIQDIKQQIHNKQGIPPLEQIITFGGKSLTWNTQTIDYYGIGPDCTLHLSLRLLSKKSAVTIKLPFDKEIEIMFDPNTILKDIKQKCLSYPSINHLTIKDIFLLHQNNLLNDDNIKIADINGIWDESILHTTIKGDAYHSANTIQWNVFHNNKRLNADKPANVQQITNMDFEKPIDEMVYEYFQKYTDLHPFFSSGHCPVKSITVTFKDMEVNLNLNAAKSAKTFNDGDGSKRFGLIPKLSLNSLSECFFTTCTCCESKRNATRKYDGYTVLRTNKTVFGYESLKQHPIKIDIKLSEIGFIFNINKEYFYLSGKFYKRCEFDEDEISRKVDFQFYPIIKQPQKLGEELLISGYIRCNYSKYTFYEHIPLDIIQLICFLFPQYYGGQYEVSKHNHRLNDKLEPKTNAFTINNVDFYLEVKDGKTWLIMNLPDNGMLVTFLCQIQCKATNQSYTLIKYPSMSAEYKQALFLRNKLKHLRGLKMSSEKGVKLDSYRLASINEISNLEKQLKSMKIEYKIENFGDKSSLESLICNIQILRTSNGYNYLSKLRHNAYLLEYSISKNLKNLLTANGINYNNLGIHSPTFESKIFYNLFVLRLKEKFSVYHRDYIPFTIQMVATIDVNLECKVYEIKTGYQSRTLSSRFCDKYRFLTFNLPLNEMNWSNEWMFRVSVQISY